MLSINKKLFKGPWGTEIKIGGSISGVFLAFLMLVRWQRPAMGFTYEALAFVIEHKLAVIFLGTTLLSVGLLLPQTYTKLKKGNISILISAFVILGIILPCFAFLSPMIESAPRWAGPSVGLVQINNSSGLGEPISKAISQLNINLDETVELSLMSTKPEDLSKTLKNVSRYQHDIVILDYHEPTKIRGANFANLLNPRSLYILTRPGDPNVPLPSNVVYLSPPVVEEVYALASLIPPPAKAVQIIKSDTSRSSTATGLLRHVLSARGHSLKPDKYWNEIDFARLNAGQLLVWVGWQSKLLPDGTEVMFPSVIEANDFGNMTVKSMKILPYITGGGNGADSWRNNQILALSAIFEAHFIEAKRPLNTKLSINAVVHRLANEHLTTVSRSMRLVPRYAK